MQATRILTIKAKKPLYKGEELAERVELIELNDVGFEIVSQKDLYKIGDRAVYIQPDYCVSDTPIFESFIRPFGDESKSMLGKVDGLPRRIRAKKFGLHKGDGMPVYSNGILLPLNEVAIIYPDFMSSSKDYDEILGITKWEEPEETETPGLQSGSGRSFPEGIYKTDETDINNLWGHMEKLGFPMYLVGTEKVDGSSISIGVKAGEPLILSRKLSKPMQVKKVVGRRKKTFWEKVAFWENPDLNIIEKVDNDDDFVKAGKPYLDLLLKKGFTNIILRGELNGSGSKGSGNKYNPASKLAKNIKFFGIDKINNLGIAEKMSYQEFCDTANPLQLPMVEVIFLQSFANKEDLQYAASQYFKDNLIEGIVVRTLDSKFSAKIMNPEYDSKK